MSGMSLPNLLVAFATFRQNVQPEWFAHIHPHGHATARLARSFTAACVTPVSKTTLDEIEFGAYLHDIGKYLIPKEILFKPGPLEEEEREIISLHPVHGVEILRDLPYMTRTITETVLYHHERWDGAGYPDGLAGIAIPLEARIVAVVDVYASLRARRSYKPPLTRSGACELLRKMAGHELDPGLVHDFLRLVEGHVPMKIARPHDPNEPVYSSLIRETLRAVLEPKLCRTHD
jgi:HD-GYP domain-containing protein (c-di-GMP phosphodiesterase class II)